MARQEQHNLKHDSLIPSPLIHQAATDLKVSVMITTHNRVKELKQSCEVLESLSPAVDEVLICADGCTDNTVELIKQNYQHYRLFINPVGRGSVASRDYLIRQAKGDLVLALDDDSYPLAQDIVTRLKRLFHERPRLAVASFPQRTEEYSESLTIEDFGSSYYCGTFACAAACFRRSVYFEVDGFDPSFFHMYEEPDYALQCLAAGYEIYFFTDIIIRHHFTSTGRNEIRTHHRHARNEQWSMWRRCPFPYVLVLSLYRFFSQFRYAVKRGMNWVIREPFWWFAALQGLPNTLLKRNPISWQVYRLWLSLLSQPIYTDEEWQERFSAVEVKTSLCQQQSDMNITTRI